MITPTNFNVKIIEEQIVRNSIIKHEVTHTIENVTNVDHRILTCPSGSITDLIKIGGIGAGTFPSESFEYARITNLDSNYSVALTISGSMGSFTQEITPNNTIFLSSDKMSISNFTGSFQSSIESLQLYPISGSVDIEYTIVNS